MSVRHGLLALLDAGPKHGYQLRGEFEQATGGTWPLNIGQVYTTLNRLERDGLVVGAADDGVDEGASGGAGRVRYRLTEQGRAELHGWLATPVGREDRPRDELAIKLALALAVVGADVAAIVQTQRTATLRLMQQYTRLKAGLSGEDPAELSWSLVLDSLIFTAEAEIRWLDHCEGRLAHAAARRRTDRGEPGPRGDVHEADRQGARR